MKNVIESQNRFFLSLWVIFLLLLLSYSIYVFLISPELALNKQPQTDQIVPYVSFRIILGIYFLIAILSIKKIFNNKILFAVIILTGIVSRLILIPSQPVLEDDYYRYLWDGAVTANGFNPYIFSPEDVMDNSTGVPTKLKQLGEESEDVINNVNHPHVRTIYPALAQGVFAIGHIIAPWQIWLWKLILFSLDIVLLFFLFLILKQIKLPLAFLSVYWLNPLVIHEFFNAAHMDLLAIFPVVISVYLYLKKKHWMAIVCLAIATGLKLWPLVLLALYLRPFWKNKMVFGIYLLGYSIIVFILFIPVLSSNIDESLGFVRYAGRWVNNSAIYTLFQELIFYVTNSIGVYINILPRIAIAVLYIALLFIIIKRNPEGNTQFLEKALLITAVLYLISPTQFPWYYVWMVPFLVFRMKVAFLLYPVLLPLYQLNYLSKALIYVQHLPVILIFLWEIKYKRADSLFYPKRL